MRIFSILLAVVGVSVLILSPESRVDATPSGNGLPVFSVSMIGPAHDITPVPNAVGNTCTASDILFPGVALPALICAARVAPAPPGPVPDTLTNAPADMGLDTAGVFTDDLDALSFGETAGRTPLTDFDFSVDPAPANGGVTVGGPVGGCPAGPPNVTTEAAALEAQGDIFTTLGVPAGCNQVAPSGCVLVGPCDEATLGLIAPNAGAPGVPPLDNVDAIAEMNLDGGACPWGAAGGVICPALSLTPGSVTLGLAPADTFTGLAPDAATILVPPSAIPNPPNLAFGCPVGGTACAAVHSSSLGLLAGDDLDALCWFDRNGDRTVDLPTTVIPTGDTYMFSLAPGSPTLGALGYSAADILTTSPGGPVVSVPAASLGLLATDNIDGLTCHLATTDTDGDGYSDIVESGAPLCGGAVNEDVFDDAVVNDGCPALEAAEGACGDALDSDADGLVNDGCPVVGFYTEAAQCSDGTDSDGDGSSNDGCPTIGAAEVACGGAGDDDGDGIVNDGCPAIGAPERANNTMTRMRVRCEAGPTAPSSAWPPDFVSGGPPATTDLITLVDVTSFLVPIRRLDQSPGGPGFNARWDLVPGPSVPGSWIQLNDLTSILAGTTGLPPMFGGAVRAFNGPACTDP